MLTISATDIARNFSKFLDRVEHHGEEFVIVRNQQPIAKVSPGQSYLTALEVFADLYHPLQGDLSSNIDPNNYRSQNNDWLEDSKSGIFKDERHNPWDS